MGFRSCGTPRFRRANERCSTCRPLWPSPQGAFLSVICFSKFVPWKARRSMLFLQEISSAGGRFGHWLALVTILSEGALLFVAAQAGFIDGPRVMSNMAIDSWFPHRFANLSERLTMHNGVLLMGGAALLLLLYTHGNISTLVVMYSINVFATFSLSELGNVPFFYHPSENRTRCGKSICPFT